MDSDSVKNGESNGVILPVPQQDRKLRKDKGSKRKEGRSVESVMKALEQLPNPAEKFEVLRSKYAELADESKKYQLMEKKLVLMQKEKEQMLLEHDKTNIAKSRLEQLCRELQKQNKAIKEESLLKIRDEEEKRKELSAKFNATMSDITALMQQNSESNAKLRDENLAMQNQFKGVCGQYELREQQVEKMGQQMKLESQLAEAKLSKAHLELKAQQDVMEREKAILMAELARCQAKCLDHEKIEATLRAQINVYFEKYDEFQTVLNKSNQVYAGFKTEMDKMSKKITRLEKETASWKQKWEVTHKSLLSLAVEKQTKDNEVAQQARQLTQLQKLCRTMTAERSALMQQLSAAGITPAKGPAVEAPSSTETPPTTESPRPTATETTKTPEPSPRPTETSLPKPIEDLVGAAVETKSSNDVIENLPGNGFVVEAPASPQVVEVEKPLAEVEITENSPDVRELLVSHENSSDSEKSQLPAQTVAPEKVPETSSSSEGAAALTPTSAGCGGDGKADPKHQDEPDKSSSNTEPRVPPQEITKTPAAAAEIATAQNEEAKSPSPTVTSSPSSNGAPSSANPGTPKSADKAQQQSKKTPPQSDQKKMKEGNKRRKK